jgi:hypothetical protein
MSEPTGTAQWTGDVPTGSGTGGVPPLVELSDSALVYAYRAPLEGASGHSVVEA